MPTNTSPKVYIDGKEVIAIDLSNPAMRIATGDPRRRDA
jgi:hypothetical protein